MGSLCYAQKLSSSAKANVEEDTPICRPFPTAVGDQIAFMVLTVDELFAYLMTEERQPSQGKHY